MKDFGFGISGLERSLGFSVRFVVGIGARVLQGCS